ncbi:hypothetical protein QVD17_27208 [Tagetes erecta]|uniref:UBC core domain-containing protein n=1 Tax=Tagetes erecta TaxID=13708 RepID=A0AAD8NQV1_TARER|nr:hypothetical protein QVD17_27208 [Tagetes erecta]
MFSGNFFRQSSNVPVTISGDVFGQFCITKFPGMWNFDPVHFRLIVFVKDIYGIDSEELVKRKYMKFKKFDIVEDYSDHHYSESKSSSCLQASHPPRDWAKKILKEWEILHRDLPDMIFVRVYEGRMDLLRAVIVGVEGTPYYDGLFFFDVCFPLTYPNDPPNFEDVVIGHFHDRANSILTSCTAYYAKGMGVKYGVNVGSLKHMNYVEGYMKTLVRAFKQIGVEDVDDFVPQTGNKVVQLQKRKENLIQKIMSCLCI